MCSASNLKICVIEGNGGLFWFFVYVNFFFPNILCWFFLPWIVMGTLSVNHFQSKLILHFSWYSPLVYVFINLFVFNVVFCVCSLFDCVFFSTDVNNTWITGHIHRSIVVKMEPTSEYVEMVKHSLSNTLGYIFLWNVIRSIYLPCLQLISKQILLINRDEYPTPVFTSTVE